MKNKKIYFWPQWFKEAHPSLSKIYIDPKILCRLQQANLFLWSALNIYDDILDQSGQNDQLPIANSTYRCFLSIYYRLNLPGGFYKIFDKTMTDLDQANRQEALHNRFKITNGLIIYPEKLPSFSQLTTLSRKSLALGLAPAALLCYGNNNNSLRQITQTLQFFRYLLAAKQLADDARDWLADLNNGIITAANLPIIKSAKRQGLTLDLQKEPTRLYLLFATESSPKISNDLRYLCDQTRHQAEKIGLSSNCRLLTETIRPLEESLAKIAYFRNNPLKKVGIML